MSRRPTALVLGLSLLYALLYSNKHWGHRALPAVLTSYLADVLALPLLLTVALLLLRHGYFRQPTFVLPGAWVVGAWVVFSVWFEGLLPRWQPAVATADPLDVLAYAVGGWVFWRWLNVP